MISNDLSALWKKRGEMKRKKKSCMRIMYDDVTYVREARE